MSSAAAEAIIEVSIPMRYFDEARDDVDCPICAHAVCPEARCRLSQVTLSCCEQVMCCGCFSQILKRCRCSAECQAVVGSCPFCRDMCRAEAVSIFLSRVQPCRKCKKPS